MYILYILLMHCRTLSPLLTKDMKTLSRYGILLFLTVMALWGLRGPIANLNYMDFMDSVYVNRWCNMGNCFDSSLQACRKRPYKHYIYPIMDQPLSDRWRNIMEILGWDLQEFYINGVIIAHIVPFHI